MFYRFLTSTFLVEFPAYSNKNIYLKVPVSFNDERYDHLWVLEWKSGAIYWRNDFAHTFAFSLSGSQLGFSWYAASFFNIKVLLSPRVVLLEETKDFYKPCYNKFEYATEIDLDCPVDNFLVEITLKSCLTNSQLDHGPSLRSFRDMFGQDTLTDVVVKTRGKNFRCHKLLLASQSEYFKNLFKDVSVKRVNWEAFDREVVEDALHYLYTGLVIHRLKDNTLSLMEIADQYQIEGLKEACRQQMQTITDFHRQNVVDILTVAVENDYEDLQIAAVNFMVQNCDPDLVTTPISKMPQTGFDTKPFFKFPKIGIDTSPKIGIDTSPKRGIDTSPFSKSPKRVFDPCTFKKSPANEIDSTLVYEPPETEIDISPIAKSPEREIDVSPFAKSPEREIDISPFAKSPERSNDVSSFSKLVKSENDITALCQMPEETAKEKFSRKMREFENDSKLASTFYKSTQRRIDTSIIYKSPDISDDDSSILFKSPDISDDSSILYRSPVRSKDISPFSKLVESENDITALFQRPEETAKETFYRQMREFENDSRPPWECLAPEIAKKLNSTILKAMVRKNITL